MDFPNKYANVTLAMVLY